jgi:hypothetical protein
MSRDLAAVRAELRARRTRAGLVSERYAAVNARLRDGDDLTVVEVRCDKGDRSMLAKAYALPEGLLFTARIEWLPSDQLTLRPWQRDAFLCDPALGQWDDRMLSDWLDYLAAWTAGLDHPRSYWLKGGGTFTVRDVLTEPAGESGWLPELWTRCRRHPQHAEVVDRTRLLAATRNRLPTETRPR